MDMDYDFTHHASLVCRSNNSSACMPRHIRLVDKLTQLEIRGSGVGLNTPIKKGFQPSSKDIKISPGHGYQKNLEKTRAFEFADLVC